MARWQLTEPHYLNSPNTFWEQVVTDRITQRPVRKQYRVPLHLDPRLKDDWNYNIDGGPVKNDDMDGIIVVAYAGKGEPRDKIFEGPPTPGMLPLDDEARAISAQFTWTPTERVYDSFNPDDTSHQAKILAGLTQQLANAMTSAPQASAPVGMDKFMENMAEMMRQQTMLFASMMERLQMGEFMKQAQGAEPAEEAEPLEEADAPTAEEIAEAAHEAHRKEVESRAKAQAIAEASSRGLRRA